MTEPVDLGPAAAARLLQSMEGRGISAADVAPMVRLWGVVMLAAAESGDVAGFEVGRDALRELMRRARDGSWLDRTARRAAIASVRDVVSRGAVTLCARGAPPRFGVIRGSLEHVLALDSDFRAPETANAVQSLVAAATAQCVSTGSRRASRGLSKLLRRSLEGCSVEGDARTPPALAALAITCAAALLERLGTGDRAVSCMASLAAARALPWSAAVAAEAADSVIGPPGAPTPPEALVLAHAVASQAWQGLGDPVEGARHAAACRALSLGRAARRWGDVPGVDELIERVRAAGNG